MRVLGLDPGSVLFGYGVIDVERGRASYVECGVLVAKAHWTKYRRLAELGRDLEAVLDELKPDQVALEAGFVKGQQGALTSGAARGVAGFLCTRRGLDVVEYAATAVKKAVVGYGGSKGRPTTKTDVARAVGARLGIRRWRDMSPDASDALAVALIHASRI